MSCFMNRVSLLHFSKRFQFWIAGACICVIGSCIRFSNTFSAIPPGIWRGTLELSQDPAEIAEEHTGAILPFNFEVRYITEDSFVVDIINGSERITCDQVAFGRNRSTGADTIRITLPAFGTYFSARYEEDAMQGFWYDPSRGPQYRIPFRAYYSHAYRFKIPAGAGYRDFAGRWKAVFGIETNTPETDIALIKQDGNKATGTILTETGDYRYLAGNVEDDRIYLSTFDGSHAYLFEAKILDDGTLSGIYRSGNHYRTYWTATRDDSFKLTDPFQLTHLMDGYDRLAFTLPNTDGKMVSLTDPQYAGKPKLVSMFGTWCPNCLDENVFLTQYFREHPHPDIAIISLAFERQPDSLKAVQSIRRYRDHVPIPWEILYGGSSKHEQVLQKLPMIAGTISYPTLFFLNRDNTVVKIHTGFYGPATEEYADFKKEFDLIIHTLTAQ